MATTILDSLSHLVARREGREALNQGPLQQNCEQAFDLLGVRGVFRRRHNVSKMLQNRLRLRPAHDRSQRCGIGVLHRVQAAEVLQQSPRGLRAYAGNFEQLRFTVANLAPLAMERYRETVRLIAYQLDEVQHRRMTVEHDRITLLSMHVNDL